MAYKSRKVIEAKRPWYKIDWQDLFAFRWVFVMLAVRDVKLRYKQTLLGALWVILQPLMTATLFLVVFGRVLSFSSGSSPYLVFAFCALVPWLVFSGALQRASTCLINDTRLITRVYFPRIYLPLSATFGMGVDFLIGLGILFGMLLLYGIPLTLNLTFFPVVAFVLFLFSSAVNLLVSSITVYFRDIKHIIPFLLQFWMFASPLAYATDLIPQNYYLLYCLNPLVGIIDAFRFSFLGLETFPLLSFSLSFFLSLFLFLSSVMVFRRIEPNFADVI